MHGTDPKPQSQPYVQEPKCITYISTFVDFQKANDSVDRHSLFQTVNGLGLDNKTSRSDSNQEHI